MRTLIFTCGVLAACALTGCKGFHAVGPMAKVFPPSPPKSAPSKAKPESSEPPTASTVSRASTSKAIPPTTLVNPEDVTDTNFNDIAKKLEIELSTDSKVSASGPVTVEVSQVKK